MYSRWQTCEVKVGDVGIGGKNPIRLQSMTTSPTRDVGATLEQIRRLVDVGCELVRVTVQGMKEAEACEEIKNSLVREGLRIPLIADIHFYPPAALRVVEYVDKVRINPGNFVDKRASFRPMSYDEEMYQSELEKLEEGFTPLVEKCLRLGKALRIGANHGSLSDRIMNRYGDTPRGMVESAFEFARVCRKRDYHQFVFSMKASNPRLMIEAYRLLVARMGEEGWNYPLHLGVTEAGEGEEGRVKSAIGMGALLLEGLGDTLRVSLTEDPWQEIDPCRRLARLAQERKDVFFPEALYPKPLPPIKISPPLHPEGSIFLTLSAEDLQDPCFFEALGGEGRQKVDGVLTDCIDTKLDTLRARGIAVLPQEPAFPHFTTASRATLRAESAYRTTPVLYKAVYLQEPEEVIVRASAELGSMLCEGWIQGFCLEAPQLTLTERRTLAFAILQGCRMRMSKTEFISCPGCGRTLFDLQEVSRAIRAKTAHLPGVKIAIMGCIVNGPGEMADADFGYVGSKTGMIDLYVGKECVERNIPMQHAEERLISLLRTHGRWIDKNA